VDEPIASHVAVTQSPQATKEGPDRVVGRDVTDQSGAYRVPVQNPSGRFCAVATKKAGGASGGGNCLKARSKKERR
jgi:hypothetical protein